MGKLVFTTKSDALMSIYDAYDNAKTRHEKVFLRNCETLYDIISHYNPSGKHGLSLSDLSYIIDILHAQQQRMLSKSFTRYDKLLRQWPSCLEYMQSHGWIIMNYLRSNLKHIYYRNSAYVNKTYHWMSSEQKVVFEKIPVCGMSMDELNYQLGKWISVDEMEDIVKELLIMNKIEIRFSDYHLRSSSSDSDSKGEVVPT
jgi:hypothetical protein